VRNGVSSQAALDEMTVRLICWPLERPETGEQFLYSSC
jgi:hypothetical protein